MERGVSLVIVVVLVLQFAGSFDLYPRLVSRPSHRFWPFLDYPMYRAPHYEGDVIARDLVFGRLRDGSEVAVTPADLGLSWRKFRDLLVSAIRSNDEARVATFARIYEERVGMQLVAVRVERHGHALARGGLVPVGPRRIAEVSLAPR